MQKSNTHYAAHISGATLYALRSLPILTLLLVVLLASAGVWGPGIVNTRGGGDSPFLLQRTHQMVTNLRAGVFPVRWMPDGAYGLGYPFFNHYSALPFYVAASFNLVGLDLLTALKLTQTLGFLMAAAAMYGFVNHVWRHRAAAWLAAVAYTVAPFHMVNVYVRGDSLSEFYAFIFYPLVLWALVRLIENTSLEPQRRFSTTTGLLKIVWLALAYSGLILAHNISAFIFSPFALLFMFILLFGIHGKTWTGDTLQPAQYPQGTRWIRKPIGMGLVGFLAGMALSAWAWLPALLERDYVQSETLTLGFFDFANHFRTSNLVQFKPLFDYSIQVDPSGRSPFSMGGVQALVATLGLVALLYYALDTRHKSKPAVLRRTVFTYSVVGLLLATFMITPLSQPLWDYLPLLATVQFPWRFLSVQALFASIACAALVLRLGGWRAWASSLVVSILLAVSTLLPLRPDRLLIGPGDVTSTRLQEYELFTSNIGTTIRWEWLPQDADPRPYTFDTVIRPDAPSQIIPVSGTLIEATQTQRYATEQVWQVKTGEQGATVAFPLLYWPGWHAWVDDVGTPVWATEGSGYLTLTVSEGEHTVHLKLGRTSLRAGSEMVSLITFVVVITLLVWRIIRPQHRATDYISRARHYLMRYMPHLMLLSVALLFLVAQSSSPPNRADDLTMDFVALPYLHHNPEGVEFADASRAPRTRLLSYAFSNDRLAPGETLAVTLRWDDDWYGASDGWVTLRLVSPAEHLPDLHSAQYALAEDSAPLAETVILALKVPDDAPRGLYLLQLSLWEGNEQLYALTPSGDGRGPLYLRPVRVPAGAPVQSQTSLLALVGPDIRLHAAKLEQTPSPPAASGLTVQLTWSSLRRMVTNFKISVRLLDRSGHRRVAVDTQPGYGFAPTSLWRPGEQVADRYLLPLPDDLPAADGYRLQLIFYHAASQAEAARVELGPFALPLQSAFRFEPQPRLFELPSLPHRLDVDFFDSSDIANGDHIRLADYDLSREDEVLHLTLWWTAQRQPTKDYTVFVHLFDPGAPDVIVTQNDAMPRQGGYPTSGWLAGEVVRDTVRISLQDVPAGNYRLAVGLYDATTRVRLAANPQDGVPLPEGRLILADEIRVPTE